MNETISSDQGAVGAATPDPDPAPPRPRRLVRPREGRVLGGVCAGLATVTGIDVAVVRLLWVLATVMIAIGPGTLLGGGVFAYAAMWFILPDELGSSPIEGVVRRLRGQSTA